MLQWLFLRCQIENVQISQDKQPAKFDCTIKGLQETTANCVLERLQMSFGNAQHWTFSWDSPLPPEPQPYKAKPRPMTSAESTWHIPPVLLAHWDSTGGASAPTMENTIAGRAEWTGSQTPTLS